MTNLRIALIGYGRMGKIIEQIALSRGHEIAIRIDQAEEVLFDDPRFLSADVAIEFTRPEAAYTNCSRCLDRGIPVISGTTGWSDQLDTLIHRCEQEEKTLFWASNFSIGVNLFFEMNKRVAQLMNQAPQYNIAIEEIHHVHKLDAPSGTAITLAESILSERKELKGWQLTDTTNNTTSEQILPITAIRQGEVPGIHTTTYTSTVDTITLTHEAKSREGFALGAVLAAEFVQGKTGFLGMKDLLQLD